MGPPESHEGRRAVVPLKIDLPLTKAPVAPRIDPRARPLLNHLRVVALKCRAAARTDLFEACAMLSADKTVARTAHAETLLKCLAQATGKRPVMYRPGSEEVSFDEAWLARLVTASATGDADSFSFLIHSRVPHWARRNLAFLIHMVAAESGSF